MGYKSRVLRLDFSDLVEDGEECYIVMQNPALVPTSRYKAEDVQDADGKLDKAKAEALGEKVMAELITEWVMYDAETDELLALPSSDPTVMDRVPMEVTKKLGEVVNAKSNPQ